MIESGWAQSGSMAIWTRENGPFARRAVLDDHWSSENWRKLRRLRRSISGHRPRFLSLPFFAGASLLKNLRRALTWSKTQRAVADKASESLPSTTIASWNKMRLEFDRDRHKPNPYEEPDTCKLKYLLFVHTVLIFAVITIRSLRRELDNKDACELRQGRTPPHTTTANVFIGNGLRIEEQQYVSHIGSQSTSNVSFRQDLRLSEKEAIKANTIVERLAERRKLLAQSIREFQDVQKVYMPGLSHILDDVDDSSGLTTHPELFKLMLPSQLSIGDRQSWCLPDLPTLEARFRYAQADDALSEICRLRRLFQGLSDQNKKHITTSQVTGVRAQGTFERYKTRIQRFATLYRRARHALIALDPNDEIAQWTSRFLELKDSDIRGPGKSEDDPSEGQTVSSWIWLIAKPSKPLNTSGHPNPSANNPEGSDLSIRAAGGEEVAVSIRAHWARCQARAERYEEEVQLTVEEMRRTLEFFKWKSRSWLALQDLRVDSATSCDPQIHHGLRAYAHRQAALYSSLVDGYINHWRSFLVEHSLGLEWLNLYPLLSTPATELASAVVDQPLDVEDEVEPICEGGTDLEFEERFDDLLDTT